MEVFFDKVVKKSQNILIFIDNFILLDYVTLVEVIFMKRKIEEDLVKWKDQSNRMPLILNGARQVGKTFILQEFGRRYFKNTVYVNLETNFSVADYFNENIEPDRIIKFLEAYTKERIVPGETLILFDEIQIAERVLTSLKYFCEQAPQYHVAAAGSLLGVAVNREKYSYPVGKVDTLTLYAMDFEEFLWSMNEEELALMIRAHYNITEPMPQAMHNKASDYYKTYLIVGGMPAVVKEYLLADSLVVIPDVQNKITSDYIADMAKYASTSDSVKIRSCYHSIPAQLGKENHKFQYKVVQRGGTASIFGEAIDWLTFAGIVQKCRNIEQGFDPISVYANPSNFKLYMGDVGVLTMKTGISQHTVLSDEDNQFMGSIAENYVAQALASNGYDLYYWTSEHIAEVDFVVQKHGIRTAIEVKRGTNTQSKSLTLFIKKYNPDRAIKLSSKNFGKADTFDSVPLYAAFCI